jgi:hypothetical protein
MLTNVEVGCREFPMGALDWNIMKRPSCQALRLDLFVS